MKKYFLEKDSRNIIFYILDVDQKTVAEFWHTRPEEGWTVNECSDPKLFITQAAQQGVQEITYGKYCQYRILYFPIQLIIILINLEEYLENHFPKIGKNLFKYYYKTCYQIFRIKLIGLINSFNPDGNVDQVLLKQYLKINNLKMKVQNNGYSLLYHSPTNIILSSLRTNILWLEIGLTYQNIFKVLKFKDKLNQEFLEKDNYLKMEEVNFSDYYRDYYDHILVLETKVVDYIKKIPINNLIEQLQSAQLIMNGEIELVGLDTESQSIQNIITQRIVQETNLRLNKLSFLSVEEFYEYFKKYGLTDEVENFYNTNLKTNHPILIQFWHEVIKDCPVDLSMRIIEQVNFKELKQLKTGQYTHLHTYINLALWLESGTFSWDKISWILCFNSAVDEQLLNLGLNLFAQQERLNRDWDLSPRRSKMLTKYYLATKDPKVKEYLILILSQSCWVEDYQKAQAMLDWYDLVVYPYMISER